MALKFDEVKDADDKMEIIKNTDENIRKAFRIYTKKYPNYSKDGICVMLAEKTAKSRASIWRIIENAPAKPGRGIVTF